MLFFKVDTTSNISIYVVDPKVTERYNETTESNLIHIESRWVDEKFVLHEKPIQLWSYQVVDFELVTNPRILNRLKSLFRGNNVYG